VALDTYTSAVISMTGMTFDSIGGLYLAYDLLGGERGPLSKLTRCTTYSLLAFISYAVALNLKFAMICGIGMGTLFGLQLDLIGAGKTLNRKELLLLAVGRMIIMTLGTSSILSKPAACTIGIASFFGSLAATKLKISPENWYEASCKPEFRPKRMAVGLMLGTTITLVAWMGETIFGGTNTKDAFFMALRLGFVIGIGTALVASVSPFVEWYADNLPPKRMGYIGAVMFLIGFLIQSIPSLVVLLGL
jgi:hypothetical protein